MTTLENKEQFLGNKPIKGDEIEKPDEMGIKMTFMD